MISNMSTRTFERNVLIIQEHLPHYRVPFFNLLFKELAARGISLRLVFSPQSKESLIAGSIPWAEPVPICWLGPIGFQNIFSMAKHADLIAMPQEVKYASLSILLAMRPIGRWKIALWGHGKNFQALHPNSIVERYKRFLSRRVDWWFAYNHLSVQIVKNLGFPSDKITNVMNSIDTSALLQARDAISPTQQSNLRKELGLFSKNVGIYSGGLYAQKRIPFLLDACVEIRKLVPDFEMIVIGKGPDVSLIKHFAHQHAWLHYVGPKDDHAKVPFFSIAKVFLMPGLVGLAVLDSFALGVPLVTTAYPYHSPEIDYLKNDSNGYIVSDWENPREYAMFVASLLADEYSQLRVIENGRRDLSNYSVEKMSHRFAQGIIQSLAQP
jgi:glycosyltransferase involved in cell wall biosynthesis